MELERELEIHLKKFISVADPDPGSGDFFDPWTRDPGRKKNPNPG